MSDVQLWGYARPDGGIGIRNYVAVIAAMDNSAPTARRVAAAVRGAMPVTPSFGRGNMGADRVQHVNTLIGMGTSPNVYGAVVISLEPESARIVAEGIAKTGRPVEAISIEDCGGTVKATELGTKAALAMMVEAGKCTAVPLPWERLVLGVECGGSDGSSGLVSNPATGMVADMIVARGGTVIMSETVEVLGGEHLLAKRAKNEEVAQQIYAAVERCVSFAKSLGVDLLGLNPAPDNIAGGLSTIEEKALGAIKKGGSGTVMEVLGYGQRPKERGFVFMDAPAPGVENLTALSAAGTHLIIFSTGKGNVSGNPVSPVIKVSGNPYTVKLLADNIDVDLSAVLTEGMSLEKAAQILEAELIAVCGGKQTKAEALGEVEVSISRLTRNL
jgi:altronate dehydratase large subunit